MDTIKDSNLIHNEPEQLPEKTPEIKDKNGAKAFWKEVLTFIIIAVFVVVPIRLFIVQPFVVSGESMESTFDSGEYLLVDELSYHFTNPARGDVLIFKYPKDKSKYFIKRVIGLPGETVEIKNNIVTIKNKENPKGFSLTEDFLDPKYKNSPNFLPNDITMTLKDTEYYVLGDNRLMSSDSRYWGPLDEKYIIGRPIFRLVKFSKLSLSSPLPFTFVGWSKVGPFPGKVNY